METALNPDLHATPVTIREIEALASQFTTLADYGREAGLRIRPYLDANLPQLAKLPPAEFAAFMKSFTAYYEVMAETRHEDGLLRNSTSVWRMLAREKLVPPSDLFERMADDQIIEIYDLRSRQIFRSIQFFNVCSYSLEELYSFSWYELFERPADIQAQHIDLLWKMLEGKLSGVIPLDINEHLVRECRRGAGRQVMCNNLKPLYASTLKTRSGELGGIFYACRVTKTWEETRIASPTKPD